jgi:hypothetical protein
VLIVSSTCSGANFVGVLIGPTFSLGQLAGTVDCNVSNYCSALMLFPVALWPYVHVLCTAVAWEDDQRSSRRTHEIISDIGDF